MALRSQSKFGRRKKPSQKKKRYVLEMSKETEMVLDGFFVTFFGGRPEAVRDFVVFIVVLNS